MKQQDIISEKWKVLIILDACRYDYFEKNYRDFVQGKLTKIVSTSTWTLEWAVKTFIGNHKDIVYISANPYINSKIKINDSGLSFFGKEKFHRVIDVWDFGWDNKTYTVNPIGINNAFLAAKSLYQRKRFILHYAQPHFPSPLFKEFKHNPINQRYPRKYGLIEKLAKKALGEIKIWKFWQLIGRAPVEQCDYIIRKYGLNRLREEYEKNLRFGLKYVSQILPKINGNVLITSDHGEMLGEHGRIGHIGWLKRYKELVEVPCLKIYN